MIKLVFISFFFLTSNVYANKEGHGGYVIDCGEKNVHVLDYFEAKETIDDFHLSLGAKVSLDEGIELLLNRVKKFT